MSGFMPVAAVLLSGVLMALAAIHAYWAFGGKWPGTTEKELVDLVMGVGDKMPPAVVSLAVAIGLGLLGLVPLIASGILDDRPLAQLGLGDAMPWILAGAAFIFLARGLATFALKFFPKLFGKAAENHSKRFIELDARFYGPLCLLIGGAYLAFYLITCCGI